MTRAELAAVMPLSAKAPDAVVGALDAAMRRFEIVTPARMAAFCAQLANESGQLQQWTEHPGSNITGWTHSGMELRPKYLDLLKQAVPTATQLGVLWNPANRVLQEQRAQRVPRLRHEFTAIWGAEPVSVASWRGVGLRLRGAVGFVKDGQEIPSYTRPILIQIECACADVVTRRIGGRRRPPIEW